MADRIKVIVAKRLERGVKDPRLGFVTITDVQVTGDLQHASSSTRSTAPTRSAPTRLPPSRPPPGMLRSEVGKNITARLTPTLEFILDAIPENAAHIEGLLREARERDTEVAGLAATAEYAGDEDPYVKPREFDEDDDRLTTTDARCTLRTAIR